MSDPVFDIQIGTSSVDSRVLVNGEDISGCIRDVTVSCRAGQLTRVEFELIPGKSRTTLMAALKPEQVTTK